MRHRLYGITPEEYAARFAAQDNRCAICRTATPGGKGWHLDHDLGNFKDDPSRLRAALAYLD